MVKHWSHSVAVSFLSKVSGIARASSVSIPGLLLDMLIQVCYRKALSFAWQKGEFSPSGGYACELARMNAMPCVVQLSNQEKSPVTFLFGHIRMAPRVPRDLSAKKWLWQRLLPYIFSHNPFQHTFDNPRLILHSLLIQPKIYWVLFLFSL